LKISLLSVADNKIPGKKAGTFYNQLDLAYKNLDSGKVEGKKLVSFGPSVNAYEILRVAQVGHVFDVKTEKVGDFWQWTNVEVGTSDSPAVASSSGGKSNATPRSTYETPEERQARQHYIVRQSSLSSAIALLNVPGAKVKVKDVLDTAQTFVDFVFQTETTGAAGKANKEHSAPLNPFEGLDDDIPQ
jgi:hypothetical protein